MCSVGRVDRVGNIENSRKENEKENNDDDDDDDNDVKPTQK